MTSARTGWSSCVQVRFSEADPMGHVNNAVYLNYLEQIAIDHATAKGFGATELLDQFGAAFVARKHEIEYLRPAFVGDWLRIRTWAMNQSGARFVRYYEIARLNEPPVNPLGRELAREALVPSPRRELVVAANTEWAFMDVTTGRPLRIPAVLRDTFIVDDDPIG